MISLKTRFAMACGCALLAPTTPIHAQEMPVAPSSTMTAPQSGAFDWKLRLQPGQKWQMRLFTRLEQDQTVPATANTPSTRLNVKVIQRGTLDYEVLSVDRFGASTVRLTYGDFAGDTSILQNGQPLGAPDTKTTLKRLYGALKGASVEVKQAPDGTVWNVVGLGALQKRIVNALPGLNGVQRAQTLTSMGSFASDEQLRSMMRSIGGQLPTQPVRVGESWNYTAQLPAGLPIQISLNGTRTLKARENGVALIGESATFDVPAQQISGAANAAGAVAVELRGTMQGFTRVDEASGLPLETQTDQRFSGTIEAGSGASLVRVPLSAQVQMRVVMTPQS